MPVVLECLSGIGVAAMLWVGGGILVHGFERLHAPVLPGLVEGFAHAARSLPGVGPLAGWLAFALASAVVGLAVGAAVLGGLRLIQLIRR
jgi:hypothetical protein